MKRIFKIISWNVNGLRAISKKGFFEWATKENPDILCLQETKAHEDQLTFDQKIFNDYSSYFANASKKGYSGVATYTKVIPKTVSNTLGNTKFDTEGRIMFCEYDTFSLFNIYFPNGQMSEDRLKHKLEFYEHLIEFLNKYKTKQKNIIICGDVNTAHKEIDLFHPKENSKTSGFLPVERAWIDKLINNGFVDTFRKYNQEPNNYTWWSARFKARPKNIGWRIDYFFVSKELLPFLKKSYILSNIEGSDHCPIGIEIEL